jgi:hypothetical protein
MATYGSGKVQLSFAEEEWTVLDLVGSTVNTNTITGLSGLTVSKYTMRSLGPGASVNKVWNAQDNTATVVTVEEATLTSDGLANTDDVSITQHGYGVTQANITGYIGDFDEDTELPDPVFRPKRLRAHGVGRHYADEVDIKWEMHSPLKFIVLDWKFLFFAFGHEYTTGADKAAGGGSDIDEANGTGIGSVHLDVTDATNYAQNDYIQIDTGTTAEVRKITAVNTNALTLDKGMRFAHADADTCNEVQAPYTHTLLCAETSQLPTFALCASYDEATDQNRVWKGCCVNKLTLRSSTDSLLEAEMDIWAQDVDPLDQNAKPSVTVATTTPYQYHMVDGGISINGTTYAKINSFELMLNNNLDERYYHCDLSANKPFEHIAGGAEVELKMNITINNMNIWNLLRNRTEHTVSINFDRTAATDEFTITLDKCRLQQAPHGLPREGPVNVDVVAHSHTSGSDVALTVQVIDSNPYFGFV